MPTCKKCKLVKTRIDTSLICKDCKDEGQQETHYTEALEEMDMNKPVSDLTVGQLVNILTPIINKAMLIVTKKVEYIEKELKKTQDNVGDVEKELLTLKEVLIEHQKHIDKDERERRQNNIIVSGIICEDEEEINDKIDTLFQKLELTNSAARRGITAVYRLGKKKLNDSEDDYRQILIKFQNEKMRNDVLAKGKLLKEWGEEGPDNFKDPSLGTKKVFINQDESPLSRKESYRLRNERNRLRDLAENRGKKIVIYKRKLLIDDVIVDEFKIENQILKV